MSKPKITAYDICSVSIFAAIITIMSQISIPMPYGVPMTLQTLAILLAGVVSGPKKGAIATGIYIFLGAAGVPVFAGFNGGLGAVFGYTGGFIMSFPVIALFAGLGALKADKWSLWTGLVAGVVTNYTCGVVYYSLYTSNSLAVSFVTCVLIFIPMDAAKVIFVGVFGKKIRSMLIKAKVSFCRRKAR